MELTVYLSGEIHTKWRDEIIKKCEILELPIEFLSPVTNHELSDDVGVEILGKEDKKFWHDHKSAKIFYLLCPIFQFPHHLIIHDWSQVIKNQLAVLKFHIFL